MPETTSPVMVKSDVIPFFHKLAPYNVKSPRDPTQGLLPSRGKVAAQSRLLGLMFWTETLQGLGLRVSGVRGQGLGVRI